MPGVFNDLYETLHRDDLHEHLLHDHQLGGISDVLTYDDLLKLHTARFPECTQLRRIR